MKKILTLLFLLISTVTYGQQWFGSGIIANDSIVTTTGAKFGALGVLKVPYNWGTTGNYRVEVNDTTLNKWIETITSRTIDDKALDTTNFWKTKSDFDIFLPQFGERNANVIHNPGDGNLNFQVNGSNKISINDITSRLQSGNYQFNVNTTTGIGIGNAFLDSVGIEFTSNNSGDDHIWSNGDQNYFSFIDDDGLGYVNIRAASPIINSDVVTKAYADSKIAGQDINAIISSPTVTQDGFAVTWDNTADEYTLTSAGAGGSGIDNLVEDTSPQLGGNLDLNSFTVGNATAADLTKLNGITSTATELNYTDGVTSAIQGQLDGKMPLSGTPTLTGNLNITTPIGNSFKISQNSIEKLSIGDSYTTLSSDGTFPSSILLSDFPTDDNLFLFRNSGVSEIQMTYQTNEGANNKGYLRYLSNSGNGEFSFRKDTLASDNYAVVRGAYPASSDDFATKQYVDDNIGGGSGISSLVEDTSPQLGGNLDLNGNTIGTANITNTEIGYLDGASSNVQGQLDNRVPLSSSTHDITGTSDWTLRKNNNGNVGISKTSGTGNLVLSNSTANEIQLTNTNASGNVTVNNSGLRTDSTIVNEGRLQQFTGGLKIEELVIGDWDMSTSSGINVELPSHIPWNNVRAINVMIRQDNASASMYPLDQYNSVLSVSTQGGVFIVYNPTDCSCTYGAINLVRLNGGIFDTANFDSTSYNRGWITITYKPN